MLRTLSKFNERALKALGYSTTIAAFTDLARITGSKLNYIKLRRDEFDVFFPDGPRQGWHKREPAAAVLIYHLHLKQLTFDEFF